MNAKYWKKLVQSAVESANAGQPKQLDLLAKLLEEQERAKQMLRDKGYGWTGLGIYETVRDEVPSILEPIEEHTHIPILDGQGHITWHGKNPPSEKQMKAFEEMARLAIENADQIKEE